MLALVLDHDNVIGERVTVQLSNVTKYEAYHKVQLPSEVIVASPWHPPSPVEQRLCGSALGLM